MKSVSTIAIRRTTQDILKEIGHKGETYNKIIQDLIGMKGDGDSRASESVSTLMKKYRVNIISPSKTISRYVKLLDVLKKQQNKLK